jgi:DNA-binding transcriptional LysR family regulator
MLDPLTLDQMRVLVAVAEAGSFSAAARKLGRVQSAISQSVQAFETALGTRLFERDGKVPKLNDAGRVILDDARRLIRGAETLKARADSIAAEVEPELTLAVDAIFPDSVMMESLRALAEVFPFLPVTLFTEGLGGAEQRLRDGVARLGLFVPLPSTAADLDSEFLVSIPTVPVVASRHRLAEAVSPIGRSVLEENVQLVLTDRTPITAGLSGGIVSPQTWRFADPKTRLDYLLAGFGWCHMPVHMVREAIGDGRLRALELRENTARDFPIHVVHERGRLPGKAGRWLIEDLRERVKACTAPLVATAARR